jgi:hypothetical protein
MKDTKEQDEGTDNELEDLFLYYKAFSKHPPDVDESNAESAARHEAIDDEYRLLQQQNPMNQRNQSTMKPQHHTLSPFTQLGSNLMFQSMSGFSSPIIEPMSPSPNTAVHTQQRARHHDTQRSLTLYKPRQALETPDHRPNL